MHTLIINVREVQDVMRLRCERFLSRALSSGLQHSKNRFLYVANNFANSRVSNVNSHMISLHAVISISEYTSTGMVAILDAIREAIEQIEASSVLLKSLRGSRALNVNPLRPSECL